MLAYAFSWLIWLFIHVCERCVKVSMLMLIRMQNAKRLIKTRRVMREHVMVLNCLIAAIGKLLASCAQRKRAMS